MSRRTRGARVAPIPLTGAIALLAVSLSACGARREINSAINPGSPELKMVVALDESAAVFDEIMSSPDKGIPREILSGAQCVVIIPGLQSYSLVVGAEWGSGFISCRRKNGAGWTAPGAVSLMGGSFGFQLGSQSTDLVMLVMNQDAERRLLANALTVGVDASAAAGPVGRSVGAATNVRADAEILTWSRSSGLFAGVSIQGARLHEDEATLRTLYGRAVTNRQVVLGQSKVPEEADRLIGVLNKYSMRG